MVKINFGDKFKGKELWKTVNLVMFFSAYSSMIFVPIFFPDYLVHLIIGLAFIAMAYVAIQQAVYRKMEQKNAGRRVLSGWLDEEEDLGEEFEFPIKKITPFERLSEADQEAVNAFMEKEQNRIHQLGLRDERVGQKVMKKELYKPSVILEDELEDAKKKK